ncbi:MAG: hypothetical protein Q8941_23455 [Bacteroidota bacterium]|nr:hypothetical protein [Bacteroidota bacterium]
MERLIKAWRSFYGIAIAGLGFQQFFYADFRPVLLPEWRSHIPLLALWVYIASIALIAAGLAIVLDKKARMVSLALGGIFLALLLFVHVPYQLIADPYNQHLGSWTDPLKELALSGGAFVIAGSVQDEKGNAQNKTAITRLLEKMIPLGSIFFSITMISFGIDHFFYTGFVASLVPAWVWDHIFWTYFAGVALIGSGVAIILQIRLKAIAILLGTMIFLWFVLLHIPRALANPYGLQGNEITSVFEALGFSGVAFIVACGPSAGKKTSLS